MKTKSVSVTVEDSYATVCDCGGVGIPRVASYLNRTLASQGTKFVTIAECMGDVPYRTNPRPTNDPTCSNGILSVSKRTCCATSCGKCGGTGCGNFLGSANNCCEDTIRTFKYTQNCNSSIAPCIMK